METLTTIDLEAIVAGTQRIWAGRKEVLTAAEMEIIKGGGQINAI